MQSAEKEISTGLFRRQLLFCFLQGSGPVTNAWAIAKVASDWPKSSRILLDVDARLVGNLEQGASCSRIERFPRDFAVQLHGKVRCYDAHDWDSRRENRRCPQVAGSSGKPAALRLFGTLNACKGSADGGRVQTCGD
jgi:hypothetical protein